MHVFGNLLLGKETSMLGHACMIFSWIISTTKEFHILLSVQFKITFFYLFAYLLHIIHLN